MPWTSLPRVDDGATELVRTGLGGWVWQTSDEKRVSLAGDVRFHDVSFGYEPGTTVLAGLNLFAKPGQKIAFVGSTGAGKTTITNLINRFYDVDAGSITYDGIDVRDIAKASLRGSLGIVLQDTHLFTGTISDKHSLRQARCHRCAGGRGRKDRQRGLVHPPPA